MDGLVSATLGELVSRCISLLINKYYSTTPPLSKVESLQRLDRMLLRVMITVEEAEGRCITNQSMLRQLKMLREEMWRGYYMLDTFRYLGHEEGKAKDTQEARSLALSIPNPGKRAFLSASATPVEKELKQMLDTVENVVTSMTEFVVFLKNYPPICRQPYSMHMFLGKCMFGRQAEMERVITFLLQPEPPGEHKVSVLPIVGQGKVGKSTLVEHVCGDVRVRGHFSQIVLFCGNKSIEEQLCTLRDGGIIKHQTGAPNEEKMLFVIELERDIDDGAWRRLYAGSRSFIPRGSKIIITSRSEKITRLGTTQALWLKFLPREANWYFFKVLAFGSSDPEEQPKLASIAMEIFEGFFDLEAFNDFTGPIANSINIAAMLRANVNIQYWRRILTTVKGNRQRNPLQLSSSVPSDTSRVENKHLYIQRLAKLTQDCVVDNPVRVGLADEDIPKITMDDVISGRITPQGGFDIVMWKSHLPPYYCYITSCEIRESKFMLPRNKGCKRKDLC